MQHTTQQALRERNKLVARDMVLDAAERLLRRSETAEFSMRALAAEAGVGFATPFNHFGNKNAIMQALSSRLMERMAAAYSDETPAGDAIDRVLVMGRTCVRWLLEQPEVCKAMFGSLGAAGPVPGTTRRQSVALWSLALGDFVGIVADVSGTAMAVLPDQLALAFRGCLSFWIAGELKDQYLVGAVEASLSTLLLGFADPGRRPYLVMRIRANAAAAAAPD
jgi:AcrR family transcriptional regulator